MYRISACAGPRRRASAVGRRRARAIMHAWSLACLPEPVVKRWRAGLPWMNASSPGERSRAGWDRWDGRSSRASGASTCVAASACRGRVGRRHSTSRLESAGTGRPSRTQTRNSSHQSAADSTCAFCCTRSVARSDCSSSATRWQAGGGLGGGGRGGRRLGALGVGRLRLLAVIPQYGRPRRCRPGPARRRAAVNVACALTQF